MTPFRLAVATSCFDGPLPRKLAAAAECGAEGLRFDARNELRPRDLSATGRRQFLQKLGEFGLHVAGLVFPTRRALYDEADLEARVEGLRRAMEFAYELRGPLLVVRLGALPEPDDPARAVLVDVLDDLVRHAGRVGTTLAVSLASLPPQSMRELLGEVADGPIGVELDPAGCVFGRHDPVDAIRSLHDRIVHVRLRDGVRDVDGSGLEVPVGRGDVDWTEVLPTLQEAEFHGWVTADRTAGDDRPGDLRRALAFVNRLTVG